MSSEDLDWIVNLTHTMRKSTDTDEYYIKHPTGRKLLLEEEVFDTSDKGEVLKIMQHLGSHKAPMTSFSAQMMKVLEDKDGQEGFVYDVLKSKEGKALVVVKWQRDGMTSIAKYGEGFGDISVISKAMGEMQNNVAKGNKIAENRRFKTPSLNELRKQIKNK